MKKKRKQLSKSIIHRSERDSDCNDKECADSHRNYSLQRGLGHEKKQKKSGIIFVNNWQEIGITNVELTAGQRCSLSLSLSHLRAGFVLDFSIRRNVEIGQARNDETSTGLSPSPIDAIKSLIGRKNKLVFGVAAGRGNIFVFSRAGG